MKIKLAIEKDGKSYYADGDKVFSWLFERYTKSQGRKGKSVPKPYDERVNSFFTQIVLDEAWLSDMRKAFPGINIENELDKAKAWLLSNKAHKKDLSKFCYNWISRANPTMMGEEKKDEGALEKRKLMSEAFRKMEKTYKNE